MDANQQTENKSQQKHSYQAPKVTDQGRVEDLTQWVGGLWGEFMAGQGSGWNPWKNAGSS